MGNSKFFRLLILFSFLFISKGFSITDPDNPDLDDLLLNHSIYGKDTVILGNRSSTPKKGMVGTLGLFSASQCDILTEDTAYFQKITGDELKVDAASHLVYKEKVGWANVTGSGTNEIASGPFVYSTEPQLPDLTSLIFKNTNTPSGSTLSPGHFTTLTTSPGQKVTLTAGVYYFSSIQLGPSSTLEIAPDALGSYKTVIYIDDKFTTGTSPKIIPQGFNEADGTMPDAAKGQILVMSRGSLFDLGDASTIVGTIVVPEGKIKMSWSAKLFGQALAKVIDANGLDGGNGVEFTKLIKANITITPPKSINEDPNMNPDDSTDNVSTISVTLSKIVPAGTGEDGNPNQVSLQWQLLDGDQKWDTDYKSTDGKSGTFTFLSGQQDTSINLTIIDEYNYDPNESFSVRFFNATDNIENFQIDFGGSSNDTTHVITINNDDLDNTAPKTITLSPSSIDEEKAIGSTVGLITVTDDQETPFESKVEVTSTTIPLAPFSVVKSGTGASTTFTLVSSAKFDYEAGPRFYDVELTATDAGDLTKTSVVRVDINPINDNRCVTQKATFSVDENATLNENLAVPSYLTDADELQTNNRFKYSIVTNALHHSTLNLAEAGTFSYVPNSALEVVKDSFSYTVVDSATYDGSNGHISPETWVIIDINNVNDNPPITINKTLTLKEGETKSIGSLFTDADISDSHTMAIVNQSIPAAGTATIISGEKIQYATTSDVTVEEFSDVVTFSVTDAGGTGTTVQGTLNITIDPQNDNNPNPSLDTITVIQGDITTFKHNIVKTDNSNGPDIDLDEHPTLSNTNNLKITTITGEDPQYCQSLVINDNFNITYNVDPNEFIPAAGVIDILEYSISDAVVPEYDTQVNSGTDSVFVKIIRNPDSDPIAVDDNIIVKEGKSITFNVMTNDGKKVADLKNVVKATDPANGTVVPVGDSSFTYTHDDTETESDSFTYTLWDEAGYTKTATVYITIELLNDNDPTVVKQTVGVIEGELDKEFKVLTVPAIESDTDLRTNFTTDTTGIGANGGAKYGTLIKVDEYTYRYSQDKDATGIDADTVIMYVHDNVAYDPALRSQLDTTIFPITPSNDYPPTTTDFNITINELEDTVINLNGFIDDDDLPDDVLTLTIKSQTGKAGTATFDNAAKTITYTADPDVTTEEFDDIIVYTISDDGGHSTDGTINMTILPLNDNAPIANRDSVDIPVGQITTVDIMLDNDTDADKNPAFDPQLSNSPIKTGPTNPSGITVANVGDNRGITVYFDENVHNAIYVDSIEYEIEDPVNYDGTVNNATGWLIIRAVVPDDNDPIGVQDRIELLEDGTATSLVGGATSVMTNDQTNKTNTNLSHVVLVDSTQFGSLTLNADGTFSYSHDDVEEFNDKFTYKLFDVNNDSSFVTQVTIAIDTLNDKLPAITDDAITVDEGGSKTIDILANDSDIDILTIWVTDIVQNGTHGTAVKNADGSFTYTHSGSENTLIDTFLVEVKDSVDYDATIHVDTNIVAVTINPVTNKIPVANDGTFPTIKEGLSTTLDISSLYSDADMPNDVLTVEIVNETTPAGSASIAGNIVTYQHDIDTEIFTDQIVYKVTDSEGNSDNGTLSITIEPLNDNAPVVTNDTISVRQGTPLTFTVTGNDTDDDVEFDSTFLKILSNSLATRGTVVKVDDSTFTYTMDINFEIIDGVSDVDSFTYIITDSVGYDIDINQSAPGMVFINLLKDEQGYPKTLADTLSLKENELVSSVWSIMDNDTMGFAGLKSIDIVSGVSHGVLTVDPITGVFTYDHDDAKEEFSDQFIYTLTDSVGNVSNASLVTLVIDTLNDNVPVVANENLSVDESATATINVLTTETDADIFTTLTPTLAGVNGGAKHGTATVTPDGTLTYVQNGVEGVQADTVIINITDVTTYDLPGLHTVPDTVFIQVAAVNNNTPSGTAPSYTIKEGETLSVVDSLLGLLHDAKDADLLAGNALSAVLVTKPLYHNEAAAPFAINANGTFTYIHDDSENFSDSLVYDITDGLNTLRLTAKISIEPVNDNAPIAENDTYIGVEGGTISPVNSVLENDSDIDLYLDGLGGTITTPLYAMLEPLQLPMQGTVTMTPDGLFTYTHNGSETVNDSFAYIVVDTMQGITFTDTAKVYITIPQVAPTADSALYYDEDGNGLVEEIVVYFNDSIDVTTTTFTAVWAEDATPLTVLSATNTGTTGSEVSLAVEGSPLHRTSGEITVTITHGPLFEGVVASVVAQDKAAPTVTAATYYYDESGQGLDSLRVFFSEDVSYFIGNPYNYLDVSTGAEFSMELTAKSHVGSVITYDVVSKTIKQVNTGDSIQINIADIASDTLENYQDLTIWAPITLEGAYPIDFEFLIVPQPMLFIKIGDKKSEAAPLNEDMMEYYNFPATAPTKGVAFILYAKMPLAAASLQQCTYTILDQTGNVVQEAQPLTFTLNADSEITGVGVWEGKNKNGRVVAKSSYLVVVDAQIMTENGEIVPFHVEKPIATYGLYE